MENAVVAQGSGGGSDTESDVLPPVKSGSSRGLRPARGEASRSRRKRSSTATLSTARSVLQGLQHTLHDLQHSSTDDMQVEEDGEEEVSCPRVWYAAAAVRGGLLAMNKSCAWGCCAGRCSSGR